MISRALLSSLLLVAGVLHLVSPELFNEAIPFIWKKEINILSGILEVFLGAGLWSSRFKDKAARACALWFLILTPVHVYVSFYQIPMFGVSNPWLLWGRTFLQAALFFWALSLQDKGWIMAQRWSEVLFLHYEVDASELQKFVPYPLDLYHGKAVISIVPFVMSRIRFPFIPPIVGLSSLYELNLRTYVSVHGRPGVYFFTLDSNHLPGVCIARWFFSLPYRWKSMKLKQGEFYQFESKDLKLKARIRPEAHQSEFDRWATERYALMTRRGSTDLIGVVEHEPWELQKVDLQSIEDQFSNLLGEQFRAQKFLSMAYCKKLDVRFRPFRAL
jgi:uncharacterized protein